jgi:hypothetical protein
VFSDKDVGLINKLPKIDSGKTDLTLEKVRFISSCVQLQLMVGSNFTKK